MHTSGNYWNCLENLLFLLSLKFADMFATVKRFFDLINNNEKRKFSITIFAFYIML